MEDYLKSCRTDFWKRVFQAELAYIVQKLRGCKDVLSIGCGPAVIEAGLAQAGFNVTGLDVSQEALGAAPETIRKVVGSAEHLDFQDGSFDAVIYVASLQFIDHYEEALQQSAGVLKSGGMLLAMLLNPASRFFRRKAADPTSYVSKIRHTNLDQIETEIGRWFHVRGEYFLGIKDQQIFESRQPEWASLYVLTGTKRTWHRSV